MRLFVDRLPLRSFSAPLSLILGEPGLPAAPRGSQPNEWFLDTAFTGEAFAWRDHLQAFGLDPSINHYHRTTTIGTSATGERQVAPIRMADLWLVSNIESLAGMPYCLPLDESVVFRDASIPPEIAKVARPLIGMRLLFRAKLRVELDFAKRTLSIWTPETA